MRHNDWRTRQRSMAGGEIPDRRLSPRPPHKRSTSAMPIKRWVPPVMCGGDLVRLQSRW